MDMKVALIDNYDSFTYNLVHYLEDLGAEVTVFRNDAFEIEELEKFTKIMLSPGPGLPSDAGLLKQVIATYSSSKDIFGVCLGLQAIAEVFGGTLLNLQHVFHGVASEIEQCNEDSIFEGIPRQFIVGRYHSWVVDKTNLPEVLVITSIDSQGAIMSLKHRELNVRGVQFHPESIMTTHGKKMIENWLFASTNA